MSKCRKTLKQPFDDYKATKLVSINNFGQDNVFVSAPKSVLVSETLTLDNYGNSIIQVDVGGTWTIFGVTLDTISSGSINYFSDFTYSYALPDPGKSGKVCLNATSQAGISVGPVKFKRQAQVSYRPTSR